MKEFFCLGWRRLGRATDDFEDQWLVPDKGRGILEAKTEQRINRNDIRIFQKLYFALLSLFQVRKCFYIHHYMAVRTKTGWAPVSKQMDLEYLEPKLDRVRSLLPRSRFLSLIYLGFHGLISVLKKGSISLFFEGVKMAVLLKLGFNLAHLKRKTILLGFITACDPWIHDDMISGNCGKGEISTDLGYFDSGADANVARERLHRELSGSEPEQVAR